MKRRVLASRLPIHGSLYWSLSLCFAISVWGQQSTSQQDSAKDFVQHLEGSWSGLLTQEGDGPLPAEGVELQLDFGRDADGSLKCVITAVFQKLYLEQIEIDSDAQRVQGIAPFAGQKVKLDLSFADDRFSGTLEGNGLVFQLSGKRGALAVKKPVPLSEVGADQWREDVQFLAAALPERHKDWFRHLDRDRWDREIESLLAELQELDGREITIRLSQLVALGGDAHSRLAFESLREFRSLPIQFRAFPDGLFITGIDEKY